MSAGQVSVGDGTTVKSSVLVPVPSSVVTEILPVVAVAGTTARICVVESTVNDAETELNFTSVALTKVIAVDGHRAAKPLRWSGEAGDLRQDGESWWCLCRCQPPSSR